MENTLSERFYRIELDPWIQKNSENFLSHISFNSKIQDLTWRIMLQFYQFFWLHFIAWWEGFSLSLSFFLFFNFLFAFSIFVLQISDYYLENVYGWWQIGHWYSIWTKCRMQNTTCFFRSKSLCLWTIFLFHH